MKNKLWNILLLVLCISLFFGCSDTETKSSVAPQKTTPAPSPTPVESAAYPVGEKDPFEDREYTQEECQKVLEEIFPEAVFTFGYETNPQRDLRYDGPWYIFHDGADGSYGVNPKGGKLMYYQPSEKSYTRTEPIGDGELQSLAQQTIEKLAPGKFDLDQMKLERDKFGFFMDSSGVYNWTSVVNGVDIRHEACVKMDECGNVIVVFLEYNYGFEPDADALTLKTEKEAEEALVRILCEDPMVGQEMIHISDCRLTVNSQDNHRIVWRFLYELESPEGDRYPHKADIDAMSAERIM